MLDSLLLILGGLTAAMFFLRLHTWLLYPLVGLSLLRRRQAGIYHNRQPLVSVIIPAYNEEAVLENCVRSILRSTYPRVEILIVNDGSTDNTWAVMQRFATEPQVRLINRTNGGKAAALNAGIACASGEVYFFVDADGIFQPETINQMLAGFRSEAVGAVCGSDSPVNLNSLQTQLLALQTHVTTSFVRRALALINCLPIVSGNIGAFRRDVITQTGPFRVGCIGEDLELTWRVHRAGYRVEFQPEALVYAESPTTLLALWKQRVRWARGLWQTVRLHKDMFFNRRFGPIAFYLPINVLSTALMPILQLVVLGLLLLLLALGYRPFTLEAFATIAGLGFGLTVVTTLLAISIDRAWRDLRYCYVLPLWIPYAFFMNFVALRALILEIRGTQPKWNKLTRSGVVSRKDAIA